MNLEDLIEYKRSCAIAKKTFKQKKRQKFREFASTIDHATNPTFVWNKCKVFKNKWVKIEKSSYSENLQLDEKIKSEIQKTCPPWACTDPEWIPNCPENQFFDEPFNFIEFNVALENANNHSSPGMDGIDYEILQKLDIKFKLLLLDIYNDLYQSI